MSQNIVQEACEMINNGQFSLTIEFLEHHLLSETDSKLVAVMNEILGDVWTHLGEFTKAVSCYDEAIKVFPNNAQMYFKKGSALKHHKDTVEDSVTVLEKSIELGCGEVGVFSALGFAHKVLSEVVVPEPEKKEEHYEKAVQNYEKALRLDPEHSSSIRNLADIAFNMQHYEMAVSLYLKLCQKEPENIPAFAAAGHTLMFLGDFDKAITILSIGEGMMQKITIPKEPHQKFPLMEARTSIHMCLAQSFIELKKPQQAQEELHKVIETTSGLEEMTSRMKLFRENAQKQLKEMEINPEGAS